MRQGRRILAVVPARSGSKGIADKNMQRLAGTTLIGWAGSLLAQLPWVDARLLSTDSPVYAEEGRRFGLAADWLRPAALSTDSASAIDVAIHALSQAEAGGGEVFDVVLLIEPTSPLRLAADIEATVDALLKADADSAVTVSPVPAKFHPMKLLKQQDGWLGFHQEGGRGVVARQQLGQLWWRNGVCYAATRDCLLKQRTFFGKRCIAVVVDHAVVNIDEPWELAWAACLVEQSGFVPPRAAAAV